MKSMGVLGPQAIVFYYGDAIMGAIASQITSLNIVYSTVYLMQIKENIKAPRHWPLCGEFTGDRWIPGKCFHLMTSSCDRTMRKHRCYNWDLWRQYKLNTPVFDDCCVQHKWWFDDKAKLILITIVITIITLITLTLMLLYKNNNDATDTILSFRCNFGAQWLGC